MTLLKLAGVEQIINEPVFKQLRRILASYKQLTSNCSDTDKTSALETLLDALTGGKIKLQQLKNADELSGLLAAVPAICGLTLSPATPANSSRDTDWGSIYAHLSATFGWTYDYINDHMTLSRVEEYRRYMANHPATHLLAAAYLGYEHQDKQAGNNFLATIAAQVKANQGKHS